MTLTHLDTPPHTQMRETGLAECGAGPPLRSRPRLNEASLSDCLCKAVLCIFGADVEQVI